MRNFLPFALLVFVQYSMAQVSYELKYLDSTSGKVEISINFEKPLDTAANFVFPRSIPGHYSIVHYDRYVEGVTGYSSDNTPIKFTKDDFASRWRQATNSGSVSSLKYRVDIKKMETMEVVATDFSLIRPGYLGVLNYSVFGWMEGTQYLPVKFTVQTFQDWRIFSTIDPKENPSTGNYQLNCENYFELADGQTILGPEFQLKKFTGEVSIYVVSYSQTTKEYLDDFGLQAVTSVSILKDYFGKIPFKHYTIVRHLSIMPTKDHLGGFAMEHLTSMTAGFNERSVVTTPGPPENLMRRGFGILHHMGHAFLPLRTYGDRYVPRVNEIPPIIRNIWFNEGFIWLLCYDTLKAPLLLDRLNAGAYGADKNIKDMPLILLSEIGSTSYSADFRIGQALFSRGALMAKEMNEYILEKSKGKKSMKDVFRY